MGRIHSNQYEDWYKDWSRFYPSGDDQASKHKAWRVTNRMIAVKISEISQMCSTQLNTSGRFWTIMLDSALYHLHQTQIRKKTFKETGTCGPAPRMGAKCCYNRRKIHSLTLAEVANCDWLSSHHTFALWWICTRAGKSGSEIIKY